MSTVIQYVDPGATGSADGSSWTNAYRNLATWEAQNVDLVSDGDSYIVYVRDTLGIGDTLPLTLQGWNTSSTYFITITTEGDTHRASASSWGDTKYTLTNSSGATIVSQINHIVIDGIQVESTVAFAEAITINTADSGGFQKISNCRIRVSTNNARAIRIGDSDSNVDIWNTIIYSGDSTINMLEGVWVENGIANIYNSTIWGPATDGIEIGAGTTTTIINTAIGNTTDDIDDGDTSTIQFCISDDGDGDSAQTPFSSNWNNEFINTSLFDFRTLNTGNARGNGTDDPGSGLFNNDIDGNIRTSIWDIGASEFILTTVTRYVDTRSTPGGDGTTSSTIGGDTHRAYFSLSEWESNEQTDLINARQKHIVYCNGDSTGDTVTASFSDWTSSSENTVTVTVANESKHLGYWSDVKYRLEINDALGMHIREPWFIIDGLQIHTMNPTSANNHIIEISATGDSGYITIRNCLLRGHGDTSQAQRGIYFSAGNNSSYIYNNIIYGIANNTNNGGYFTIQFEAGQDHYVYNNTLQGSYFGLSVGGGNSGDVVAINNIAFDSEAVSYGGSFAVGSGYNMSDRSDAPGDSTNNIENQTPTFINDLGDSSFILSMEDVTARESGLDIRGDSYLTIFHDAKGDTKIGTSSMGAFDFNSIHRFVNTSSTSGGSGKTGDTTGDSNRAYANLSEWESNEQTDLVSAGDRHTVHCIGSGVGDTLNVTVSGWTTGETNYIQIQVDEANRSNGIWDNTKYYLSTDDAFADALSITDDYVRVFGLQVENLDSNSRDGISYGGAGEFQCAYNIGRGMNGIGRHLIESVGDSTSIIKIWNNIIMYANRAGIYITDGDSAAIYNNTVFMNNSSAVGTIYISSLNRAVVINNLNNNGDSIPTNTYTFVSVTNVEGRNNIGDTNLSDLIFGDSSAFGTASETSANQLVDSTASFNSSVIVGNIIYNTTDTLYAYITNIVGDTRLDISANIFNSNENYIIYSNIFEKINFLDESNYNFHIFTNGPIASNNGIDLSGDSFISFSDDIDGDTRI